jgi:hypothetical protein
MERPIYNQWMADMITNRFMHVPNTLNETQRRYRFPFVTENFKFQVTDEPAKVPADYTWR